MAQDLKTISIESFKIQIFSMKFAALKQLLLNIQDFKAEYQKVMNHDEQLDILRKETIVINEIQSKQYVKDGEQQLLNKWYKDNNFKKRFW